MKDKTAQTQAGIFYETIVDVLGYPRHQVMYVLSDNTASVSGDKGGCVTLLQEMLRKDEAPVAGRGGGRGRGRGRGRGLGRGWGRARGGRA